NRILVFLYFKGVYVRRFGLLVVLMLCSVFTQANTIDPYYQISNVKIEVLEETQTDLITGPGPNTELGDIIATTRQIIAFGKEIYKIIVAGKPVVDTKYTPISVLPLDTEFGKDIAPADLARWQPPKSTKFKVTYENGYGSEVIAFTYNI